MANSRDYEYSGICPAKGLASGIRKPSRSTSYLFRTKFAFCQMEMRAYDRNLLIFFHTFRLHRQDIDWIFKRICVYSPRTSCIFSKSRDLIKIYSCSKQLNSDRHGCFAEEFLNDILFLKLSDHIDISKRIVSDCVRAILDKRLILHINLAFGAMSNPNEPKPGSSSPGQPIRRREDIQ